MLCLCSNAKGNLQKFKYTRVTTVNVLDTLNQAVQLQRESRFADSAALFEAVVGAFKSNPALDDDDPVLAATYYNLATARTQLGHAAEAARDFQNAIDRVKNPDQSDILLPSLRSLGILQLTSGKFAAAQASFERVLGREPWDQSTAFNLYSALKEQGKMARAVKLLEFVVQLNISYTVGAIELAEMRLAQDFTTPAMLRSVNGMLREAIQANPSSIAASITRVQTLIELGELQDAIMLAEELIHNGTNDDHSLFGQLCVAQRLRYMLPSAAQSCQIAIDLSNQGQPSIRQQHHIARPGQEQLAHTSYWVQYCFALSLHNRYSVDENTILEHGVANAISACRKAAQLNGEHIEALSRQTYAARFHVINAHLMVHSCLANLLARQADTSAAQKSMELVLQTDFNVTQTSISQSKSIAAFCSPGGAGTTSLMHAMKTASISVNAGHGASFLKHRTREDFLSIATEVGLGVDVLVYVLRDPRNIVLSIFRRQFQQLLAVQLGGLRPVAPEGAAALQSFEQYILYLAQFHTNDGIIGINSTGHREYFDPLPISAHLQSWTEGVTPFPRVFVLRNRLLDGSNFERLCDSLKASLPQRAKLMKLLEGSQKHIARSDWTHLSEFQKVVLTRHFERMLEFVEHQLRDGFLVIPAFQFLPQDPHPAPTQEYNVFHEL